MAIEATPLAIPDVILLQPNVYQDERGHFFEVWNAAEFVAATGCTEPFVQDNQSQSQANVVRGLHYQIRKPQGKLVRVVAGSAFMVALDIRRSSPTFGEAVTRVLSAENHLQLWVPPGFAHGFLAQHDPTEVLYKVTAYFAPDCEREVKWDDPALGIDWPLDGAEPMLSDRDMAAPLLADADVFG